VLAGTHEHTEACGGLMPRCMQVRLLNSGVGLLSIHRPLSAPEAKNLRVSWRKLYGNHPGRRVELLEEVKHGPV